LKAKRNLLLLLLVLVAALGGALALLTNANKKAEQAASEAEQGSIVLASFAVDDLTRIQTTYGGETLTLDYEDGVWTLAEDPAYHISQSQCDTMATALCALNAKRSFAAEELEDLANYGVETPIVEVTATVAGEEMTFRFGDINDITGDLYLQKAGDEALYTVASSKAACFEVSKTDLFDPFNPAGITRSALEGIEIDFDGADESFTVQLKAVSEPVVSEGSEEEDASSAESEDDADSEAVEYQTVWRLVSDPAADLDETALDDLLAALCTSASGQITNVTQPEELAYYGLDAPLLTVRATTDAGTTTLYYAIGTDGYYWRVEGDESVYSADADTLAALCLTEDELKAE
jgi:hypothetical protein